MVLNIQVCLLVYQMLNPLAGAIQSFSQCLYWNLSGLRRRYAAICTLHASYYGCVKTSQ